MLFALRRAVKPQIVTVRETLVDVQIGVDPGVAQFGVDEDGVAQQEVARSRDEIGGGNPLTSPRIGER